MIDEDLSACDVIIGVKEVPIRSLLADKIYIFFSHTIKGQPHNMPMLSHIMQNRISLADYELMVDPATKLRTIMFGYFAGCAGRAEFYLKENVLLFLIGTIDILNGLGERMLAKGYRTPWLHIAPCRYYEDLEAAKHVVTRIGMLLDLSPPNTSLGPFVFSVTGGGNVARGALDILKCMPHQVNLSLSLIANSISSL